MQENIEDQFLKDLNHNIGIVHRVCRVYVKDGDERQDMYQEIIYQLWKSYPSFKNNSKFSTWMYRVAVNTAINHVRKSTRAIKEEPLPENIDKMIFAEDEGPPGEKLQMLYAVIGQLSPVDKAIILLYLDDNSYDQIAGITGFTKSNVSVRLVRIKKQLEKKLKNER
ncbi:RNA polymerase sigma factor [Mucilaginibacter sp. L3T2-6]|uniref:RNA polymerase sigma factor n=1 Tax=Mucilaginibacter sp. L3T2-6 TaxID=3062491 RepID=UPI002675D489|nr:RNA polymerase sigma factor [Mucilaginibacter sp. L3T2-6]MDO3643148.1 RNA polymerase sigma factor [Mucilaginibacter sp. L3T2-6]MDV6217764.1 RNA polymerase sigma factor [Mucilaginibacter sp. L3T2-6]